MRRNSDHRSDMNRSCAIFHKLVYSLSVQACFDYVEAKRVVDDYRYQQLLGKAVVLKEVA